MLRMSYNALLFRREGVVRERFWERYSLGEPNAREWEALCDGCGQCCLVREVDQGEVTVYSVACDLLDIEQSRCSDYASRLRREPRCHPLTPANVAPYDCTPASWSHPRHHS